MVKDRAAAATRRVSGWIPQLLAAIVMLAALAGAGHAQSAETLTNADVVKMVRAQLATTIVRTTIEASNAKFDVSPAGLIALKEAGVGDELVQIMQARMAALAKGLTTDAATRTAPEKSELLASSREPDFLLRNFRTLVVNASRAEFFGSDQMKAALGSNSTFRSLGISIVDDPKVADVVLTVNYTFAWDYPFSLRHQNTSVVLLSGKGVGPFSGPAGAASVAGELANALKPYRAMPVASGRR